MPAQLRFNVNGDLRFQLASLKAELSLEVDVEDAIHEKVFMLTEQVKEFSQTVGRRSTIS